EEGLEEQMEAMTFGFPSAGTPAPGRKEYPAISVTLMRITALPRKDGRLTRIQLDSAVPAGNSGGPVLDQQGKVIGVLVSGAKGPGANYAVAVATVQRFRSRPELQFRRPGLGAAELRKPVRFEARVTPVLPSTSPLTVDLILKAGDGQERTARMAADG